MLTILRGSREHRIYVRTRKPYCDLLPTSLLNHQNLCPPERAPSFDKKCPPGGHSGGWVRLACVWFGSSAVPGEEVNFGNHLRSTLESPNAHHLGPTAHAAAPRFKPALVGNFPPPRSGTTRGHIPSIGVTVSRPQADTARRRVTTPTSSRDPPCGGTLGAPGRPRAAGWFVPGRGVLS